MTDSVPLPMEEYDRLHRAFCVLSRLEVKLAYVGMTHLVRDAEREFDGENEDAA